MTSQPILTDPVARARRLTRAGQNGMFLHDIAIDEIHDRLGMVNRSFNDAVVVSPFADHWARHLSDARPVMNTDTLALDVASQDLVIHAMGLHWANDMVGQLIQCRRALRPDGMLIAALFGGQTLHELRTCLAEAEATVTGGLSPRVAPMADLRELGGLLQRAGLALPVADNLSLKVQYDDIWHLMRDLRGMGEGNALAARLRHPTRRTVFDRAGQLYAQHFGCADGRITATFEMVFLTGWAPDESQQKPLRPGSAKARLADALRTDERPLGD